VLCLREFETFRTGLFQSSSETMNRLAAETQEKFTKATAETAAQIEIAAQASTEAMNRLTAETREKVRKATAETATQIETAAQASTEAMNRLTAETWEKVRKATVDTVTLIEPAAAESRRQAELISQMLIKVHQALSELPLMTKLELPSERLEKQIASVASHIESLVAQLEAVTGRVRSHEAVTGRVRSHSGIRRRRWYWLFLR
jgi:hypothetical protein